MSSKPLLRQMIHEYAVSRAEIARLPFPTSDYERETMKKLTTESSRLWDELVAYIDLF